MVMSTLVILISLTILVMIFCCGWCAGTHRGYTRGVRDVVIINDASFKHKCEIETIELAKRAANDTAEQKERYNSLLDYQRKLQALPNASPASLN
jgi:hypothetical protein